jgi:hypothetical protein
VEAGHFTPASDSTPYSPKCLEPDFSHLEVKGIDTLPTPLHNKR